MLFNKHRQSLLPSFKTLAVRMLFDVSLHRIRAISRQIQCRFTNISRLQLMTLSSSKIRVQFEADSLSNHLLK